MLINEFGEISVDGALVRNGVGDDPQVGAVGLTLAAALKSPLVGLTDDDLVRIAAYRGDTEPLVEAMARHAAAGAHQRR